MIHLIFTDVHHSAWPTHFLLEDLWISEPSQGLLGTFQRRSDHPQKSHVFSELYSGLKSPKKSEGRRNCGKRSVQTASRGRTMTENSAIAKI